jgi:hypothetical protein
MKYSEPQKFKLTANPNRLHSSGMVSGIIYFTVDGSNFPSEDWDDFIAPIVAWWVNAVCLCLQGECDHGLLDFMDGPCQISLRLRSGSFELDFADRRVGKESNCLSCAVRPTGLVSELKGAIEAIANYLQSDANSDLGGWNQLNSTLDHALEAFGYSNLGPSPINASNPPPGA